LAKYHIERKDFQTSELSVHATHPSRFSSSDESGRPNGFDIERSVTTEVRDLSCVASLLADAVDAGANSIDWLTLDVAETRKFRDEARSLALTAAKEKAEAMASVLHVRLGKPIAIRELGTYARGLGSRGAQMMTNAFQVEPVVASADEAGTGSIAK